MQPPWLVVCASVLASCMCGVLEQKEERVLHGRPLSDKVRDGDEDYDYDHDAFLGEEDAEYFESLDPEESKRRLGVICDKIDKDGDKLISMEELQKWIQFVQEREIREDTESQWGEKNRGRINTSIQNITSTVLQIMKTKLAGNHSRVMCMAS